jgi:hypothetical protein
MQWGYMKKEPYTLLVGMQVSLTTMKISIDVSQNIKNRTTIWSRCTTSGYISKRITFGYRDIYTLYIEYIYLYIYYRDTCILMFIAALVIIAKLFMELAKVPIDGWKNKENVVYWGRHWWLMPVILATQQVEIRRIAVQSQSVQIAHKILSRKTQNAICQKINSLSF